MLDWIKNARYSNNNARWASVILVLLWSFEQPCHFQVSKAKHNCTQPPTKQLIDRNLFSFSCARCSCLSSTSTSTDCLHTNTNNWSPALFTFTLFNCPSHSLISTTVYPDIACICAVAHSSVFIACVAFVWATGVIRVREPFVPWPRVWRAREPIIFSSLHFSVYCGLSGWLTSKHQLDRQSIDSHPAGGLPNACSSISRLRSRAVSWVFFFVSCLCVCRNLRSVE